MRYCNRCGGLLADGSHAVCEQALSLEPPRYCGHCGRRLKVQVMPDGWRADCVEHGPTTVDEGR
jgi:hypothetical protein